ncbi:DUF2637 domain-containing protein [Nocardiopsis tropica]|uniref:DUF2637 domain-containing protein n=1 Tax=Nocardiopsis tropica TaxID=109330 RepID=A0ABU7KL78_9ACTN|nr:DUF2637 domain-containing protein [Nocardiopsis umidischolae]MEE2050053.1 DUF2637 domain-containing protein [Nocardiopsis umidischolae]
MTRGNGIAWLAFVTGAVVSIGANVLHALDGGGTVEAGRVIASGWAPVALLLVAELVARARTAGPWWIGALRWAGTAVVAGVAAVVSYGHMRDLLLSYGESDLVAHLLPLSVDGLLLVASLALAGPGALDGDQGVPRGADDGTGRPVGAPERAALVPTVGADGGREVVTVSLDGDQADATDEDLDAAVPHGDDRAAARQAYRAALDEGVPLTGRELAARFGRSASWGRTRIRECQPG